MQFYSELIRDLIQSVIRFDCILFQYIYPQDGLVASVAYVGELGDVARGAHGHAIALIEGSLCDRLRALAADKVLRMPGLAESGQNLYEGESGSHDYYLIHFLFSCEFK